MNLKVFLIEMPNTCTLRNVNHHQVTTAPSTMSKYVIATLQVVATHLTFSSSSSSSSSLPQVPMEGKFRRGHYSQLLGISDHQMVFLEEKTRELVSIYPLHDIQNVQHLPSDPCSLIIYFSTGQKVPFSVERER